MERLATGIFSLDDLETKGSAMDSSADKHFVVDYFGNTYRWEVAPGQEQLGEEETQEIIIIPLNQNE